MDAIARWNQTWMQLDRPAPNGVVERLVAAYGEPHRRYHTMQHLEECFAHLDDSSEEAFAPGLLELAIWFHDAIYDTRAADNEAQSARLARESLPVLTEPELAAIEALILVTQHDGSPASPDEALLIDVDLSILGAAPERFDEYEQQVRREYAWVPDQAYREARGRILREFLDRPVLYRTTHFRQALDARARRNLEQSIATLAS